MHTKISYILPTSKSSLKGLLLLLLMSAVMGLFLKGFVPAEAGQMDQSLTNMPQSDKAEEEQPQKANAGENIIYLPITMRPGSQIPFGVESNSSLNPSVNSNLFERTDNLGGNWVRIIRINWRELQPNEGGPIQWELLSDFEQEVEALIAAEMTPIVVVQHSPRWATINQPWETDCGAIREDKFPAFAEFMREVVTRYRDLNVNYWELGNEPDIDPLILGEDKKDEVFGCWGDVSDPYYGGQHYGNMLKIVAPAMRASNPNIKIINGGLLLNSPNTTTQGHGRPELFLKGILEAGAAPYFDIIGYHNHATWYSTNVDYSGDYSQSAKWHSYGGAAKGKVAFLKEIMAEYGVFKPLFLNEATLRCTVSTEVCTDPEEDFLPQQAAYLARVSIRSLNAGAMGFIWYTINGPGWQQGGLLNGNGTPRPSYNAYQALIEQIGTAAITPPQQVDEVYAPSGIEAYRFTSDGKVIDVLWSVDGTPLTVSVPRSSYLAAVDMYGEPLQPIIDGSNRRLTVGFETLYIHRRR